MRNAELGGSFWKQSLCQTLNQTASPPTQSSSYLREIETFRNERVHHSIHDGDHDDNQDGVHSLRRKRRGAVSAGSISTRALERDPRVFSYLHLVWLNFYTSLKQEEENITGKNVIKGREEGGQGTDPKRWWPGQTDHQDRQTYNLPTHGCCLQRPPGALENEHVDCVRGACGL